MSTAVKTTVTELPESRVRVQAEVPADEVERRLEQKARALGRDLKIPGFRKGKVPAPLVIQRIGREAVLDQTVRDTLGHWYSDAIVDAGIVPVGDPELDLGVLPGAGEALTFSIEIGVQPKATLGEYRGLEVGRREPTVDEQDVDREIEGLRERLARLETVERPAAAGDFVVIDYAGSIGGEPFEGGEGRDQLVELASGRPIPGFEEGLVGASAGEQRTIELSFPDDYGNAELAGRAASFDVTVKEVKEKLLPEIGDDFATDAGFDAVEELREDIRTRLRAIEEQRIESEFMEAALDAATANAKIDVPATLVQARATEQWERTLHTLSHQGISKDTYVNVSGRSEEQLLEEIAPEAEQALRRESVIAAIVEAEGVDPTDEDLLQALRPVAERERTTPEKLLAGLQSSGRVESVRADLAARKAVELIAAEATPIAASKAQARERLWTPDKEQRSSEGGAEGRLWTPGS